MIALRLAAPPLRRTLLVIPLIPALALLAGFVWFVRIAGEQVVALPARADGIVVLTGGADRIETAMHLLAQGRADVLLVSGANRAAAFGAIARRAHMGTSLADRVTIGHDAADTHGNATETATWARARGLRSLIVVTAGYHMPRALAEISRALPDVQLYPDPVLTPLVRELPDPASLRFLAVEYAKFLVVRAGLAPLAEPITR